MIKIENINVYNFEGAVRGMRNPLNSWDKSDSSFENNKTVIGTNDLNLMRRLYHAGSEHRKYLRQIFVSMDVTAPLYWWKQADQYRINVTSNSCSTMHRIHAEEFKLEDFSCEHLYEASKQSMERLIKDLNYYRESYLETKDKEDWWQMIALLPSSYNQKRTITMNYENVVTIIKQRAGHKLDEWDILINTLFELPYIKEIVEG